MAGLLYKDWLLLRRQLWYYALLLGLYLALTAAGVLDASFPVRPGGSLRHPSPHHLLQL